MSHPKLIVIGGNNIGATSFVVHYTRGNFNQEYEPTLENHTSKCCA